jgi:tetratricopeptide (TPR) repeat protein
LSWLWFILVAFLLVGGRFALAGYADHLVRQGRYDQALRLLPLLALSDLGRSRFQADVLTDAGRYEEAERILRKIIDRVIGVKLKRVARVKACLDLEDLGNVLMETGRFEESQRCFRQAAAMNPYHSAWATGKAEALLRQGIFSQVALTHAERALSLFQHGAERVTSRSELGAILATKAWALAACGRGAEAHEAIEAALKSPTRKTKGPLAQVHFKAGMSLLALSDHQGAEDHFVRGTKLDPVGRWGRLCADTLQGKKPEA